MGSTLRLKEKQKARDKRSRTRSRQRSPRRSRRSRSRTRSHRHRHRRSKSTSVEGTTRKSYKGKEPKQDEGPKMDEELDEVQRQFPYLIKAKPRGQGPEQEWWVEYDQDGNHHELQVSTSYFCPLCQNQLEKHTALPHHNSAKHKGKAKSLDAWKPPAPQIDVNKKLISPPRHPSKSMSATRQSQEQQIQFQSAGQLSSMFGNQSRSTSSSSTEIGILDPNTVQSIGQMIRDQIRGAVRDIVREEMQDMARNFGLQPQITMMPKNQGAPPPFPPPFLPAPRGPYPPHQNMQWYPRQQHF